MSQPKIAVEPKSGRFASLEAAVQAGGGVVVPPEEAEALVWADPYKARQVPEVLAAAPSVRWVALPYAGIEPYVRYLDHERTWTCARAVYARPVAEHVLALGLAGLRNVVGYAKATSWGPQVGTNLLDGKVTIFGAGGITSELVKLLAPFNTEITVVRRQSEPMAGVARTLPLEQRVEAIQGADLVVLALALTPQTAKVISTPELDAMGAHTWLVNVARGGHVDNDALVAALKAGSIGGACLDVTDPEPLPDEHPLWEFPNVAITPHVGNTPEMGVPLLAGHIRTNVARFAAGEPLDGVIDPDAGY